MRTNRTITIAIASLVVCTVVYVNRKRLANLFRKSFSRMDREKDVEFINAIGEELLRSKRRRG